MDPREELQALRRLAELEAKAGGLPQQDNLALAKQVVQDRPNTLEAKLALGEKPTETLGQYAGRSLKEMAIPMAATAAGTATGGLPGGMAGSALGETLNQALGVYPKSVIPEANQPDLARIGIAAAAPAMIPTAVKASELMKRAAAKTKEALSPVAMSNAWLRDKIGPYTDDAARVLNQPSPLPSYPQTAAEKMVGSEFGPVIQGHQRAVAQTPGGIATEFAKLKKFQDLSLEQAAKSRNAVTGPMRDQALSLANQGKVEARDVLDGITGIQNDAELGASDVVSKAMSKIAEKVASFTKPDGSIDARSLYTIRKELGNTIKTFSQETQNWDKRLTSRIEGDVQKGIDWAINNAINRAQGVSSAAPSLATGAQVGQRALPGPASPGAGATPTIWDQYLSEYSSRSEVLKALMDARKAMYKPVQRADLRGGVDIAPSAAHQILPPWLSRPVTTTKWLAEKYAGHIEPKIDRYMADLYQHPDQLAAVLRSQRPVPSRYDLMMQELLKRQSPFAAGAATQQP